MGHNLVKQQLRIAYISYEFPPDTAVGGISTYVHQIAKMMHSRGHDVVVFCASPYRNIFEIIEGIKTQRIQCSDRAVFKTEILPYFELSNRSKKFDLIESPEFSGDGLAIKLKFPDIPLIVKLHTPWFFINELNNTYLSTFKKARFMISGLVRGKLYKPFWKSHDFQTDPDYLITKLADQIQTPSISLGDIIASKWNISRALILHVPNPYIPKDKLLNIPIDTNTNTITFIGRLEIRKGIIQLSKAIAIVLKKRPFIRFRFIGNVQNSPKKNMDMKEYLLANLKKYHNNLEFSKVLSDDISTVYAQTDICVFPSIWENFPYTCLEAMSAGRGIVASKNGGMKDMLEDSKSGILVDPSKPAQIANALILLIDNKSLRKEIGANGRKKVLSSYSQDVIGQLVEQNYRNTAE